MPIMQHLIRVAVIQMNARIDKEANLATAERLLRAAALEKPQLVVLPELFNAFGDLSAVVQQAEPIPGPTSNLLSAWAKELGVVLCAGSVCEQSSAPGRGYNTSLLFDYDGALLARYRKMHLFDVELPGQVSVCESRWMQAGEDVVMTATRLGNIGQAICYDVRFPELFRRLAQCGAEIVCVPAAFTATTGPAHWEVLLRARAIENQCYVLAANQYGAHDAKQASYGG